MKEVPSWRLILTLAAAGAMAGLAIVLVFGWAEPKIEAHRAAALRAAIQEVLGGPERYETLFVVDGSLTTVLPANVDSTELDRIYAGYAADGSQMGFAIAGEQPGYQDIVGLIFGYDAESGQLLGMKVLESKETPGLGDKIEKDSAFVSSFRGVVPLIEGVKAGTGTGSEHEVDMITGATISSRTVIEIINKRMESIGPMIQAYEAAASRGSPLSRPRRADDGTGERDRARPARAGGARGRCGSDAGPNDHVHPGLPPRASGRRTRSSSRCSASARRSRSPTRSRTAWRWGSPPSSC